MTDVIFDTGSSVVPPSLDFTIDNTPVYEAIGGTAPAHVAVRDVVYERVTLATRIKHALIGVIPNERVRGVMFVSVNPSVASVSQFGEVTTHSQGNVQIRISADTLTKSVTHNGTITGGQTVDTFDRYVDDSLGESITDATIGRALPERSKQVFAAPHVRNLDCWIDVDLTAWPTRASSVRYNGCLISRRHLMTAQHTKFPSVGTVFQFVTSDNQIVERTVVASAFTGTEDFRLSLLDSDLPESIKHSRVLPSNWSDYLTIANLPIVAIDGEGKALAREAASYESATGRIIHRLAQDARLAPFSEAIIGGDSGSPVFAIVNGEAILLGTHWGEVAFSFVSDYVSEINAAMTALGGGYQVETIDLSSFPSFVG